MGNSRNWYIVEIKGIPSRLLKKFTNNRIVSEEQMLFWTHNDKSKLNVGTVIKKNLDPWGSQTIKVLSGPHKGKETAEKSYIKSIFNPFKDLPELLRVRRSE